MNPSLDPESARRMDPRQYVFGFGRRCVLLRLYVSLRSELTVPTSRCPGAHLIESSTWLLMVSMLATLDMRKGVDASGNVIEPKVTFDNAVFRYARLLITVAGGGADNQYTEEHRVRSSIV